MSRNEDTRGSDEVALRDLVVGDPAVNRVLDGRAARTKAEQLVREASADPRIADVVARVGDGPDVTPGGDGDGDDESVRERDPLASEVQLSIRFQVEPSYANEQFDIVLMQGLHK